jgi:DNA polymerase
MTADALVRTGQPVLVETFAEWREAARELLVHGIPPEQVTWGAPHMGDLLAGGDLFSGAPAGA